MRKDVPAPYGAFGALIGGLLALGLAMAFNLAQGEAPLALIWAGLWGESGQSLDILLGFRAPRLAAGVLSGAALAVSGVVMQSLLRNPMVSPGLVGITSGAQLTIIAGALAAPGIMLHFGVAIAMLGGLFAVALVWLVSGGRKATPLRLVLSGLVVSMCLGGLSSVALLLFEEETRYLLSWGAGRLRQNDWSGVEATAGFILLGLLVTFALARRYDIARLGPEVAAGLGLDLRALSVLTLVLVLLMTGAAVALTGPIGFIGLVTPHLLWLMRIRSHLVLIPAAALWGAVLLISADSLTYLIGNVTSAPPVGAITALLGAPLLLWLILRSQALKGSGMMTAAPFGLSRITGVRPLHALLGLGLALAVASLLHLQSGGAGLGLPEIWLALWGQAEALQTRIIWELRLPRLVVALLGGAGLALAGLLMQAILRNPLADTGIMGVNAGASAGIMAMALLMPFAGALPIALAALTGGLVAGALVWALAWSRPSPTILILTGIAVSACAGAFVQIAVLQLQQTQSPVAWLVGGLQGRGWSAALAVAPVLGGVTLVAFLLARGLDVLALGDLAAKGIGARPDRLRLAAGVAAIVLASLIIAALGPIAWIGLLGPHIARLFAPQRLRAQIPCAMLAGALILVSADWLSRILLAPTELPAGIVIALVGAPWLIFMMKRSDRR